MSRPLRVILAVVVLVALGQAVSQVRRGSRGDSDVSVFYRTTVLLRTGVGGELYPRDDPGTGWPVSLAPAGLAIFQPLARLGPFGASVGWAGFNLMLLGVSIVAVRRLLKRIGSPRPDLLLPWAAILLVVLAAGSLQVGQFSVLFVACWLLSLSAFAAGRRTSAGLLLALPSAIKMYPAMLLAAPLSMARNVGAGVRDLVPFALGVLAFALVVPAAVYGPRAWDLNVSWLENVILSPTGQLPYMQTLHGGANQSLDAVALRYLTFDPDFHVRFAGVPHLQVGRDRALLAANAARALALLVTAACVWRWRRRGARGTAHDILTMSAVWACTLYLILPETKARYAVYTFLGFLPLLELAVGRPPGDRIRLLSIAAIVLCASLILGLVPEAARVYGTGFLGAFVLWIANLRLAWMPFSRVDVMTQPIHE
jgi:hypothetical protein